MKIARIVSSNSHIDYVGRIFDEFDTSSPPETEDYGFAGFVSIPLEKETKIIGIIYNSMLMNPDYANFGPRLSPKPELNQFSPDFINEQGILIGILLLGTIIKSGKVSHQIPNRIVSAGQDIYKTEIEEIKQFHSTAQNTLQISYYSQVIAHAGLFAIPLLEAIIDKLETFESTDQETKGLSVLKQTLAWQRTMGGMRL
jgi:hypothetical protein